MRDGIPVSPWRYLVLGVVVPGDLLAVVSLQPGAAVMLALLGAIVGATTAGIRCLDDSPGRDPVPANRRLALFLAAGFLGAAGCVAAAALLASFGFIGLALLLFLAVSSPAARAVIGPKRHRTAVGTAGHSLDQLSDAALCAQWQETANKLTQPAWQPHVVMISEHRALVLDEFERRHPAAFARWLADGPVLADAPASFLPAPSDPGGFGKDDGSGPDDVADPA